jgi:hypothetical protein
MVRYESVITAVIGGVLGIAIGGWSSRSSRRARGAYRYGVRPIVFERALLQT